MKEFWERHWDKLISVILSLIVGGAIGFSGARIDLVEKIDNAKSNMAREIKEVATKIDELRQDFHKSEKIAERIDVKVSGLEESSGDAKLDRRAILKKVEDINETVTEIRIKIGD